MSKKILFYGGAGAGKTTAIIGALKLYLKEFPHLKICVWEKYPEIKSKMPEVISINNPSPATVEAYDLFVITGGFDLIKEKEMLNGVIQRNIQVWYEVCANREQLENLYKIMPCLKDFDKVECK